MLDFVEGQEIAYWKKYPSRRVFDYDNHDHLLVKDDVIVCKTYIARVTIDDHPHPVGFIEQNADGKWNGYVNWATDGHRLFDDLEHAKAHIITVFAMEDLYDKYLDLHRDIPF